MVRSRYTTDVDLLAVGKIPTFKWLEEGTLPTFELLAVGKVPIFKWLEVGTEPILSC